jgi:hypothetical protein
MAAGSQVMIGNYEFIIAAAARPRRAWLALRQAAGLRISFAIG